MKLNDMTKEDEEELRRSTLAKEFEEYHNVASSNVAMAADLLLNKMSVYCANTSCEHNCCIGKRGCKAFNRKMRDYMESIKLRFSIASEGVI